MKKELKTIVKAITAAIDILEEQGVALQVVLDEAQAAFDEKEEAWQEGDAGSKAQEKLDALSEQIDALSTVHGDTETVTAALEEIE